jgi:hypothetical protein
MYGIPTHSLPQRFTFDEFSSHIMKRRSHEERYIIGFDFCDSKSFLALAGLNVPCTYREFLRGLNFFIS